MDLQERLLAVLESVFGADAHRMTDEDGPGSISAWDSVSHLNLIMTIEAVFGVQFETSEIPELLSLGKIRARLEEL